MRPDCLEPPRTRARWRVLEEDLAADNMTVSAKGGVTPDGRNFHGFPTNAIVYILKTSSPWGTIHPRLSDGQLVAGLGVAPQTTDLFTHDRITKDSMHLAGIKSIKTLI